MHGNTKKKMMIDDFKKRTGEKVCRWLLHGLGQKDLREFLRNYRRHLHRPNNPFAQVARA